MDVAVVGAGPAGAWAAYRLARAGARVTIFDGSHPREKPCGGGVTGRALSLVRQALNGAPLEATKIRAARIFVGSSGDPFSASRTSDRARPVTPPPHGFSRGCEPSKIVTRAPARASR